MRTPAGLCVINQQESPRPDCSGRGRFLSEFDGLYFGDEPCGVASEKRRDHVEHRVTEAADVQNAVALGRLRRSIGLDVDADELGRRHAELSAQLPLDEIDKCDEEVFNRILWHAQKGSAAPYPEWAMLPKAQRVDRD